MTAEKPPRTTSPGLSSAEWTALEATFALADLLAEIDVDECRWRVRVSSLQEMILAGPTKRLMDGRASKTTFMEQAKTAEQIKVEFQEGSHRSPRIVDNPEE